MGFLNFFKTESPESPEPPSRFTRVFEDKETIEPTELEELELPERGGYRTDEQRVKDFETQRERARQRIVKDKEAA